MPTEQRFIFDEVAELYHCTRPRYPAELVDTVLERASRSGRSGTLARVLEIGCGTGQATVAFAARGVQDGFSIVALEPGPNLARCARERAERPVKVITTTFEDYALPAEAFDLVICAQAFHWIPPEIRFRKSAEALRPGGVLAVFSNKPHHAEMPVWKEIDAAYAECAPSMPETPPNNDACTAGDTPIAKQFAAAAQFVELSQHSYPWTRTYSALDYVALMKTQSNHRLLPSAERDNLLGRIQAAIEDTGGSLDVPYVAHLLMARRVEP